MSDGVDRHTDILDALEKGDRNTGSKALVADISDTAQWYESCFAALAAERLARNPDAVTAANPAP